MTWWIIEATSTKEAAACKVLERLGYGETFYPTKKVDARPRGKAKRAVSKQPRWVRRAWVPGYVFVCADRVACHVINGMHGKIHMRVLSPGGKPYEVSDEDMARMADVPQRVKALLDEVAKREREAWERVRPQVGKPAKIVSGPFEGFEGEVEAIDGERLRLLVGGWPVTARAQDAQRVDSAA